MSTLLGESGYERKDLDAYWTESWVTEWLLDSPAFFAFNPNAVVWEPACGAGAMAEPIRKRGYKVLATDIKDYGYEHMQGIVDFMGVEEVAPDIQMIITNPPYEIKGVPGVPDVTAETFLRHALELMKPVNGRVIMLLRNEFDSASSRHDLFGQYPFSEKFVLTRRPRWVERKKGDAGPRHNYSWFMWDWASDEDNFAPRITYLYDPKICGLGEAV